MYFMAQIERLATVFGIRDIDNGSTLRITCCKSKSSGRTYVANLVALWHSLFYIGDRFKTNSHVGLFCCRLVPMNADSHTHNRNCVGWCFRRALLFCRFAFSFRLLAFMFSGAVFTSLSFCFVSFFASVDLKFKTPLLT